MQGEQKTYRFFVKTFRGGVKRHAERCFLKVPLNIQSAAATLTVCGCLLCKYNARFEITVSGAVTCGGSPGLNIHCGLYTQNTKRCSLVTCVLLCRPTVLT